MSCMLGSAIDVEDYGLLVRVSGDEIKVSGKGTSLMVANYMRSSAEEGGRVCIIERASN